MFLYKDFLFNQKKKKKKKRLMIEESKKETYQRGIKTNNNKVL